MSLQDHSWITKDHPCWIEMPETFTGDPYLKATVINFDNENKIVSYISEHGNLGESPLKQLHIRQKDTQSPMNGYGDMIDMDLLNDPELLNNLILRTKRDLIYTFVGPTLLAVNPFKLFPNLYSYETRQNYMKTIIPARDAPLIYKFLPPHIYSIAAEAYRNLLESGKNQTIVISGESGAGKTENAKSCMNLLTGVGEMNQMTVSQQIRDGTIEDRIQKCNPILEAFGNAKTLRNSNSSRFGKYVKILVDDGKIQGASIINYLLEKSRITQPGLNERNFHIFYHLIAGASAEDLQKYFLSDGRKKKSMEEFKFLSSSKCYQVEQINDVELYQGVINALESLKFKEYETTIFSIISAILHLGNIDFDDFQYANNNSPCEIVDKRQAQATSQLLGLDYQTFVRIVTTKTRVLENQQVDSPYNRVECVNGIQSFARELYEKLFIWIVQKLNLTIAPKSSHHYSYVGLLDIYGFEVFVTNTFEQLFINYTNEKLHQLYIQYVFKEEERSYIAEQLDRYLASLSYNDNQIIIDLLDKPPKGIFCQLDDNSAVAGTDETFLSKIKQSCQGHPHFSVPRLPTNPTFTIRHTAKDVEYNVIGFRAKNKDEINRQIIVSLSQSKNKIISQIFSDVLLLKAEKYLGVKIRMEMAELMQELGKCGVHFVRCVKPNEEKKYGILDQKNILNQIRYLGVLETLKVRRDSYPVRRTYEQFYKMYGDMTSNEAYPALVKKRANFKELVQGMFAEFFNMLDDSLVIFGLGRVFMRNKAQVHILEIYNERIALKNAMAIKIQVAWRRYVQIQLFRQFLADVRRLQHIIRGFLIRIRFKKIVDMAKRIQRVWRKIQEKMFIKQSKQATKIVQTYMKRLYAIKFIIVKKQTIIRIQTIFKQILYFKRWQKKQIVRKILSGVLLKTIIKVQNMRAIKIQAVWRGALCRMHNRFKVEQIREIKIKLRESHEAILVQSYIRSMIATKRFYEVKRATCFLQGWFRTRWLSNLFWRIRIACIFIQRKVREYLSKIRGQRRVMDKFLIPMEKKFLGYKHAEENNFKSSVKLPNSQKIYLYSQLLDLEILSDLSDMYDSLWTSVYNRIQKEQSDKLNFVQSLTIGEAHTYAFTTQGKLYCWGLNDYGQLGVGLPTDQPNTSKYHQMQIQLVKQIASGGNFGLFLTHEGQLYATGSNRKGHCGIGQFRDISTPKLINLGPVKQISIQYDQCYALTEEGLIYTWPNLKQTFYNKPQELKQWTLIIRAQGYITPKFGVHMISTGLNFLLVLSNNGMVFSMGENGQGELGIGKGRKVNEPTHIDELHEKIIEISCGLKHSVARSSLGKIFTWGWGQKGQLGSRQFKDEYTPYLVPLSKRVQQVCAGRTCTVCILEDKKISIFGTNGQLQYESIPQEVSLQYPPVLIQASYSKTMSIINVIFANCDQSLLKNKKITTNITSKWADNTPYSVEPPFCESLANILAPGSMRRPPVKTNIKFASKLEHEQIKKDIQNKYTLPDLLPESEKVVIDSSFRENIVPPESVDNMVSMHHYYNTGNTQKTKQIQQKIFPPPPPPARQPQQQVTIKSKAPTNSSYLHEAFILSDHDSLHLNSQNLNLNLTSHSQSIQKIKSDIGSRAGSSSSSHQDQQIQEVKARYMHIMKNKTESMRSDTDKRFLQIVESSGLKSLFDF